MKYDFRVPTKLNMAAWWQRRLNRGGNGGARCSSNAETVGRKYHFAPTTIWQESLFYSPEEPKMRQNSWRPEFRPGSHWGRGAYIISPLLGEGAVWRGCLLSLPKNLTPGCELLPFVPRLAPAMLIWFRRYCLEEVGTPLVLSTPCLKKTVQTYFLS